MGVLMFQFEERVLLGALCCTELQIMFTLDNSNTAITKLQIATTSIIMIFIMIKIIIIIINNNNNCTDYNNNDDKNDTK